LWRRPGQRASATGAPLRLRLAPEEGKLAVRVVKRRGAELARPILLDLARAPGAPLYPLPDALPQLAAATSSPRHTRLWHRKAS
jgi:hypothetical protein